jgi:hypothetical protein
VLFLAVLIYQHYWHFLIKGRYRVFLAVTHLSWIIVSSYFTVMIAIIIYYSTNLGNIIIILIIIIIIIIINIIPLKMV